MVDRPLVERKLGKIEVYLRELRTVQVESLEAYIAAIRAYLHREAKAD